MGSECRKKTDILSLVWGDVTAHKWLSIYSILTINIFYLTNSSAAVALILLSVACSFSVCFNTAILVGDFSVSLGGYGSILLSEDPVNMADLFLCRLCSHSDFCLGVCRLLMFPGPPGAAKGRVYHDPGLIEFLWIWICGLFYAHFVLYEFSKNNFLTSETKWISNVVILDHILTQKHNFVIH